MKNILLLILANVTAIAFLHAQSAIPGDKQKKEIYSLIERYSEAREKSDTVLLKNILTTDVDQLVSTGEWRDGIAASVKGMLSSSANSAGTRALTIEKLRMLNSTTAIVDCDYEIENADGTVRKMWSSFIVVSDNDLWKISAIRNMLPTGRTPL